MKHFAQAKPGEAADLLALCEQIELDFPDTSLSKAQIHALVQGEALAAGARCFLSVELQSRNRR
jgi:hypothetical protein